MIATTPHISLKETRAHLAQDKRVQAGVGALWRFFAARAITFNKPLTRPSRRCSGPYLSVDEIIDAIPAFKTA
jgi:hypothetical protein